MKTYKNLEEFLHAARQFAGDDIKYAAIDENGYPYICRLKMETRWDEAGEDEWDGTYIDVKIENPPEDWSESQIYWDDVVKCSGSCGSFLHGDSVFYRTVAGGFSVCASCYTELLDNESEAE